MEEKQVNTGRLCWPDYLRVLAAFAVVLLHTAAQSWTEVDVKSSAWMAMNVYEGVSRWAVPVFVMLTGALMTGREVPLKKLYGKYIRKLAVAFVFWTVMYAVFNKHDGSLTDIAKAMLSGNYHMWYLPLAIGLYMSLPLFNRLAGDRKVLRYGLILAALFACLVPFVMRLLSDFGPGKIRELLPSLQETLDNLELHMVMGYFGYFMLGYLLGQTDLSDRWRRLLYLCLPVGLILTLGLNTGYSLARGAQATRYFQPLQPQVAMMAVGLFVLFRNRCREGSRLYPASKALGAQTLGIYLIHPMVLSLLSLFGLTTMSFHPWLSVPLIAVLAFFLSAAFTWLISKIPYLCKYIV